MAGPPATMQRLAALAGELGLRHKATSGALELEVEDAWKLAEHATDVVAPLEAGLVRVVRSATDDLLELVAALGVAPTLGQLTARCRHRELLAALHDRSGVHVGFQPIVELATGVQIGFEALLRVRLDGRDVPPAEVLAAAEDAGRIVEVDAVARTVAADEAASVLGDRWLFLNVSPASLPVPVDQLGPFADHLRSLGLDPNQVVLEAPVGPAGVLRRQLASVFAAAKELGFEVGLDNVRSERDLDAAGWVPDVVKLDRSLVRGLPGSGATRALGAVVRECQHAASMLVAQGIENPDQLAAVRDLGVRFAQGWQLGRPGRITSEASSLAS
ncbi:MAG TPA: EAL domain-containing protein [Acidimicrobiales bacterium]|nr:EAL domain-containing protein [Acidimicrobiales bacterium]